MSSVTEFGAWYPSFDTATAIKSWTTFTTDMKQLFSERLRDLPATVLWRSYSPTHFGEALQHHAHRVAKSLAMDTLPRPLPEGCFA